MRHVNAGLQCQTCHGNIQQMPRVFAAVNVNRMGWCTDCHMRRGVTRDCTACHKVSGAGEKTSEKYEIMFAVAGEELLNFFKTISSLSGIKFSEDVQCMCCTFLSATAFRNE
jgi:hypothetical protein